MKKTFLAVAVVVVAAAVIWGIQTGSERSNQGSADRLAVLSEEELTPAPSVLEGVTNGLVANGRLAGGPVLINEVKLATSGYVVVHSDNGGVPGTVRGVSGLLSAGVSREVMIELSRASIAGETLWAMLHQDDGDGEFEFPGADTPLRDDAGEMIMVSIPIL